MKVTVNDKLIRKKMIDMDIRTINQLATASGVSKPTIYDYLDGKSPLSSSFTKVCEYLNLSPLEVLTIDDSEGEIKNV